jgi:hypothetical protein
MNLRAEIGRGSFWGRQSFYRSFVKTDRSLKKQETWCSDEGLTASPVFYFLYFKAAQAAFFLHKIKKY